MQISIPQEHPESTATDPGDLFGVPANDHDGMVDATTDAEMIGMTDKDAAEIWPEPFVQESMDDAVESESVNPESSRQETMAHQQESREHRTEIESSLHSAELEYIEAALYVQQIEEEIDALKKRLKDARESRDESGVRLRQVRDGSVPVQVFKPTTIGPTAAATTKTIETLLDNPPLSDGDWRLTPLSDLWVTEPIKGMGKKKRDALIDFCPTIGSFEDLRAEAGRQFKPLADLLPEGIGQSLASELEERQLSWLARRAAAQSATECSDSSESPGQTAAVVESPPLAEQTDEPASESPQPQSKSQPDLPQAELAPKRTRKKRVSVADAEQIAADAANKAIHPAIELAGEIRSLLLSGANVPVQKNKAAYDAGRDARRREWLVTDCAWVIPSDNATDWIHGWTVEDIGMSVEKEPDEPDEFSDASTDEPASESAADTADEPVEDPGDDHAAESDSIYQFPTQK